jgi:hypothetical protein
MQSLTNGVSKVKH